MNSQLLEEESLFTHFIFADQKILNSVSLALKKYLLAFMVRFLGSVDNCVYSWKMQIFRFRKKKSVSIRAVFEEGFESFPSFPTLPVLFTNGFFYRC